MSCRVWFPFVMMTMALSWSGCAGTPSGGGAPPPPTSAAGSGGQTIVAIAPPATPVPTLLEFVGVGHVFESLGAGLTHEYNHLSQVFPILQTAYPGLLDPPPEIKAINDPANLESDNPAIAAAAEAKMEEDQAVQKEKAINYLGSLGCGGCYPDVEEALLSGLDDCTERVRYASVKAIYDSSGSACRFCKADACCSPKVRKKLEEIADGQDDSFCYKEPSARVRRFARLALHNCGGPAPIEPLSEEGPSEEGPSGDDPLEEGPSEGAPAPEAEGEGAPEPPPVELPEVASRGTTPSRSASSPVAASQVPPRPVQTVQQTSAFGQPRTVVPGLSASQVDDKRHSSVSVAGESEEDLVVARVNGDAISMSEIAILVDDQLAEMEPTGDNSLEREIRRSLMHHEIQRVIDRKLLCQEARQQLSHAELIQIAYELHDQHKQSAQATPKELLNVKNEEALATSWLQRKLRINGQVSRQAILDYYRANASRYILPEEVRWERVIVPISSYDSRNNAHAAIRHVREKVLGSKRSQPANVTLKPVQTETYGWTSRNNNLSNVVSETLFSLPVGQVSPILQSGNELQIIRVLEKRAKRRIALHEVRDEIRKEILDQRRKRAEVDYLERLRSEAVVTSIFGTSKHTQPYQQRSHRAETRQASSQHVNAGRVRSDVTSTEHFDAQRAETLRTERDAAISPAASELPTESMGLGSHSVTSQRTNATDFAKTETKSSARETQQGFHGTDEPRQSFQEHSAAAKTADSRTPVKPVDVPKTHRKTPQPNISMTPSTGEGSIIDGRPSKRNREFPRAPASKENVGRLAAGTNGQPNPWPQPAKVEPSVGEQEPGSDWRKLSRQEAVPPKAGTRTQADDTAAQRVPVAQSVTVKKAYENERLKSDVRDSAFDKNAFKDTVAAEQTDSEVQAKSAKRAVNIQRAPGLAAKKQESAQKQKVATNDTPAEEDEKGASDPSEPVMLGGSLKTAQPAADDFDLESALENFSFDEQTIVEDEKTLSTDIGERLMKETRLDKIRLVAGEDRPTSDSGKSSTTGDDRVRSAAGSDLSAKSPNGIRKTRTDSDSAVTSKDNSNTGTKPNRKLRQAGNAPATGANSADRQLKSTMPERASHGRRGNGATHPVKPGIGRQRFQRAQNAGRIHPRPARQSTKHDDRKVIFKPRRPTTHNNSAPKPFPSVETEQPRLGETPSTGIQLLAGENSPKRSLEKSRGTNDQGVVTADVKGPSARTPQDSRETAAPFPRGNFKEEMAKVRSKAGKKTSKAQPASTADTRLDPSKFHFPNEWNSVDDSKTRRAKRRHAFDGPWKKSEPGRKTKRVHPRGPGEPLDLSPQSGTPKPAK